MNADFWAIFSSFGHDFLQSLPFFQFSFSYATSSPDSFWQFWKIAGGCFSWMTFARGILIVMMSLIFGILVLDHDFWILIFDSGCVCPHKRVLIQLVWTRTLIPSDRSRDWFISCFWGMICWPAVQSRYLLYWKPHMEHAYSSEVHRHQ